MFSIRYWQISVTLGSGIAGFNCRCIKKKVGIEKNERKMRVRKKLLYVDDECILMSVCHRGQVLMVTGDGEGDELEFRGARKWTKSGRL